MLLSAASNRTSQFTSKERDAETGLDYFGARYFSGAQGRFLSADVSFADQHKEDPQSWNLYSYVRNNSLAFRDLDGNRRNPVTDKAGVQAPEKGNPHRGAITRSPGNAQYGRYGPVRRNNDGSTKKHNGIDLNSASGSAFVAAEGGTVTFVGTMGGYGETLEVTSESGEKVRYAHLDETVFETGDTVEEGEIAGFTGTSGNANGLSEDMQHLHMEVFDEDGERIDPEEWLNDWQGPVQSQFPIFGPEVPDEHKRRLMEGN